MPSETVPTEATPGGESDARDGTIDAAVWKTGSLSVLRLPNSIETGLVVPPPVLPNPLDRYSSAFSAFETALGVPGTVPVKPSKKKLPVIARMTCPLLTLAKGPGRR